MENSDISSQNFQPAYYVTTFIMYVWSGIYKADEKN